MHAASPHTIVHGFASVDEPTIKGTVRHDFSFAPAREDTVNLDFSFSSSQATLPSVQKRRNSKGSFSFTDGQPAAQHFKRNSLDISCSSPHEGRRQRRGSLDFSERQRHMGRVTSFSRHLRESMKMHSMRCKEELAEEEVEGKTCNDKRMRPCLLRKDSARRGPQRVGFEVGQEDECVKGVKVQVMGPFLQPASEMTPFEKETIWWQPLDYLAFKKYNEATSSELYQANEAAPGSYSSTIKKIFQACCSEEPDAVSASDMMKLVSWTRVAISRRGLEFDSIPFLAEAKKQNKEKIIRTVIGLHKRMKCGGAATFDSSSQCETLRNFSSRRSQSSSQFARLLAEADAAALVEEVETTFVPRRSRRRCSM